MTPDRVIIRLEINSIQAATVALNAKLFVQKPGWQLRSVLESMTRGVGRPVAMAYDGESPIGIAVLDQHTYTRAVSLNVYVLPKYRRLGVGTRLCNVLKILVPSDVRIWGHGGIRGSKEFYRQSVQVDKFIE
jgi:GNAT superfamily N-acetyltransferase